uniref:Type-4 uracil-DNA glycosylase n=1 Tax=Thermofilum pendens TaxID=2269 RepID=A0A7C3WMI3_THEPE
MGLFSNSCERGGRLAALARIAEEISRCTRCPLHASRTRTVPGEGDPCPAVVFVGEAPGYNEDQQGRPFVGAAGALLTELIESIGMRRSDVFITNVVKCRPPQNRDPKEDEIAACLTFLKEQLRTLTPKIIVMLGRHSARTILELYSQRSVESIMSIRGRVFKVEAGWGEVLLLPTLHPAAALYNPRLRNLLEEDFHTLKSLLGEEEKPRSVTLDRFFSGG